MRLSIAVIAMSNLPSMRLVSWNTELNVGVSLTSIPFFAKRPFSCATQIGQLKPPGNTMRLTVLGGAGCAIAQEAASTAISQTNSLSTLSIVIFLLRIAGGHRSRLRSRHGLQRRFFYSFAAFAKLRDVGSRAPHAERLGRERKLPRPVARLFLGQDVLHADRVFVHHLVRPLEVEKAGRRGRMTARAEDDFHAFLAQEVVGAHHVVEILDLVIDVLYAGMRRRKQRERVVDGIDAQQRRLTDPVGYPRVQKLRPERLVSRRVRGLEADVAEVRDAGVARRKIALAAVERPHHDFDLVAARVLESEELLNTAQLALASGAVVHRMAGLLDLGSRPVEVFPVFQVEADDVVGRVAFEIDERVVARVAAHRGLVAAEVRGLAFAGGELQPDDFDGELHGRLQVGRADPQVADVVEVDHRFLPTSSAACRNWRRGSRPRASARSRS